MNDKNTLLPPALLPDDALFLDFDGTLVDLAPAPDLIHVDPLTLEVLRRLQERLCGALAIVSGRPLAEIDHWLSPLALPAAGVHGAERRTAEGRTLRAEVGDLDLVGQALLPLVTRHPGLRMERKGAAVALHYREAPQAEALCRQAVQQVLARQPALKLLDGKMVLELLPQGVGKGQAVRAFLHEPPFAGRRPVFVGDDVTDEAGFEAVLAMGGLAVKVGPGPSLAPHRLAGTEQVRHWLSGALDPSLPTAPHAHTA